MSGYLQALKFVVGAMEEEGLRAPDWVYPWLFTWHVEEGGPEEIKAEMAEIRRKLPSGTWEKQYTDHYHNLNADFWGVRFQITTPRLAVCEKVVVGTEVKEVPDPEYVAPKVPMVRKEVEVVEWVCS